ncbi:hypothetical protein [Singulisphaera sp. PoT]|uniref:hypothetical protein n=1 Tax=Singulisphaera sp. PoT TaxID=3411797 RepID=UPI003BF49AEF
MGRIRTIITGLQLVLALLMAFPWSLGLFALDSYWESAPASQQPVVESPHSAVEKDGHRRKLRDVTDLVMSSWNQDEEEEGGNSVLEMVSAPLYGPGASFWVMSNSSLQETIHPPDPTTLFATDRLAPLRC